MISPSTRWKLGKPVQPVKKPPPYKAPTCPKDSTDFGGYCCYNWNKLPDAKCTSKSGSGATKLRGLLTKDVACPAGTMVQGGACVRAPVVKPVVKCSDPKMPQKTQALNGKNVCCPSGTASAFFQGDGRIVCCPAKMPYAYNGTCHQCPETLPYLANGQCVAVKPVVKPVVKPGFACTDPSRPYKYNNACNHCPQSAPIDVNGKCMTAANAAIAKQNATIAKRNAANAEKQPAKFTATVGPTSVTVTVTEPIEHTVTLDGPNGILTRKITGPGSSTFAGLLQDTEFKITVVAPNRRAMQTTRRTTSNAKPSLAVEAAAKQAAAEAAAETAKQAAKKAARPAPAPNAAKQKAIAVCADERNKLMCSLLGI